MTSSPIFNDRMRRIEAALGNLEGLVLQARADAGGPELMDYARANATLDELQRLVILGKTEVEHLLRISRQQAQLSRKAAHR